MKALDIANKIFKIQCFFFQWKSDVSEYVLYDEICSGVYIVATNSNVNPFCLLNDANWIFLL